MRYFFIIIVSLTLIGMANAPFVEMYKWTDANGFRHYTKAIQTSLSKDREEELREVLEQA